MSDVHAVQSDVSELHAALDIPTATYPELPKIRRAALRAALIEEESQETCEAILAGDLLAAVDGLCDLLAVVYGAACEFGVNLAPFWDEVHATNMRKVGGPTREDGKVLKPDGWLPPDLLSVLIRQQRGLVEAQPLGWGARKPGFSTMVRP